MNINFDEILCKLKPIFVDSNESEMKTNKISSVNIPKGIRINTRLTGTFGSWFNYPHLATRKHLIFGKYSLASVIIKQQPYLSENEYINLVFGIVNRNIEAGLLDENRVISKSDKKLDVRVFNQYHQERLDINNEEILNIVIEKYRDFFIEQIPESETDVFDILDLDVDNLEQFKSAHSKIKEHYIDKTDSFNSDDIEITIQSLKEIGYTDEICEKVFKVLKRVLYKRELKDQKEELKRRREELSNNVISTPVEQKPIIPKKEFQTVYRELNEYFDFDNMKSKKYLSLKEVIYCIHLMLKINFDNETIDEFIETIKRENKKINNNPITLFVDLYDKLKHYEKELNLTEKLKMIESLIGEIFICSSEDYEFWKENINEELQNIINSLPNNHEYELSQAKQLVK